MTVPRGIHICCRDPVLTFGWDLGESQTTGEAVIRLKNIICITCKKSYKFVDDEGDLQDFYILDIYLKE